MIQVDIRSKSFGQVAVLGQIKFEIGPGETLAISGPSGIGKTTLLRILAGLDDDFEGAISGSERVAFVFQEPTLLPWRTARDNITLTTGVTNSEADEALRDVGLAGLGDRFPGNLSLGQQRRLSLARAFAARPALLLMDEPFVSLDPDLVEEMLSLTERLLAGAGTATVLVTHTPAEAERLATRLVRLSGQPATLSDL